MKFVLSGRPRYCPLNRGVRLVQLILQKIREEKLVFIEAGVRLMQESA